MTYNMLDYLLVVVLIIGTFSIAGNRLFTQAEVSTHSQPSVPVMRRSDPASQPAPAQPLAMRPTSKPSPEAIQHPSARPEPTYHPANMSGYQSANQKRH